MSAWATETEGHRHLRFRFRFASGAMATRSGPRYLFTLGRWRRGFGVAPQSRVSACCHCFGRDWISETGLLRGALPAAPQRASATFSSCPAISFSFPACRLSLPLCPAYPRWITSPIFWGRGPIAGTPASGSCLGCGYLKHWLTPRSYSCSVSNGRKGRLESKRRLGLHATDAAFHLWPIENSIPNVEKQVQALTNYLWSRHVPVEPEELQRRATHLEKKFLENRGSV